MDLTVNQKAEICEELPDELNISDLYNNDADFSTTPAITLYLNEISNYPLLTPMEEKELAKKIANGDEQARDKFIKCNLRLVVYIAKKFRTEKFELLDLIQEGNLALLKAIETFDYTKGFKFSTYASLLIKQTIIRALANEGESIRLPLYLYKLINTYQIFQNNFYSVNNRYATDAEISKEMQITEYKVKEIKSYIYNTISLNTPVSFEDTTELGELIEDVKSNPEITFSKYYNRELIDILIANSNLRENEEEVIRLRYDFEHQEMNTLNIIAKKIGKSRQRVRAIERRALTKLKITAIKKFGEDSFI